MIYLRYKDTTLPYNTSYIAYKKFEELTGKPYSKYDDTNPEHVEALFWGSLIAGHKVEGKELKVKRENCDVIMDEVYPQIIEESVKIMREVAKKKNLLMRLFGSTRQKHSR
jgi:hypothetical protein